MASDTNGIEALATPNGSAIAAPGQSRKPNRRLGLALAVISLAQLMLVPPPASPAT